MKFGRHKIDLIVPTVPGREESLERCLESYGPNVRPTVIRDAETCGAGWLEGIKTTKADYLLLACDDQECVSAPGWETICIATVEARKLPCPRVYLPNGLPESKGGDMAAPHHVSITPKRDGTPVDYTVIPFVSRRQIEEIGMHPWHYATDVWVSYRGRQLGYETVLRHGFDVVHHHEQPGRGAGMSQSERDAMDVAAMREELERCAS